MQRAFNPSDAGSTPVMPIQRSDDVTDSILDDRRGKSDEKALYEFSPRYIAPVVERNADKPIRKTVKKAE